MQVLVEQELRVHYGFVWLRPEPGPRDDLGEDLVRARGGQANGLCGAAYPGVLSMVTGTHTGLVPLRVETHGSQPPPPEGWEDVVEVDLEVEDVDGTGAAPTQLSSFDVVLRVRLPAGRLRARWCAFGMDAGRDLDTRTADPATERYLLQLWPTPGGPAGDVVVRAGSALAAYWHGVARATPPPPPPQPRPVDPLLENLLRLGEPHDDDPARGPSAQ